MDMAILSFLVLPQLAVLQGLMNTFGQLGVNYLNGELLYTLGTLGVHTLCHVPLHHAMPSSHTTFT